MKLKSGEVKCDRCSSTGKVKSKVCGKCYGKGKLNWIDNIKGRSMIYDNTIESIVKNVVANETKKINVEIDYIKAGVDSFKDLLQKIKNKSS